MKHIYQLTKPARPAPQVKQRCPKCGGKISDRAEHLRCPWCGMLFRRMHG